MVGTSPPPGLCSFSPKDGRSVDVKPTRELRIFATKLDQRGWMSENYPSLQRREKCFLLTSPFIEPGDESRQLLDIEQHFRPEFPTSEITDHPFSTGMWHFSA